MLRLYFLLFAFIGAHLALLYDQVPFANLVAALSGSVALSCMTLSLCLAARWRWLDALTGGPDRSYRLHRWLGYGSIIGTALHWPLAEAVLPGAIPFMDTIAGVSGFYAAVALGVFGLVSGLKLVPYHWWKKSHLMMGPLYLVIVFHGLFSALPFSIESHVWWVVLTISSLGVCAWLATLSRRSKAAVAAEVISLQKSDTHIDITAKVPADFSWQPGQFVNVAVKRRGLTEYHPFSFAAAAGNGQARFIIKAAGDFTERLNQQLALGDQLLLKEVAGRFKPAITADRKVQVWAAAGVGITPFLACLDAMQADNGASIDLLYCCDAQADAQLLAELKAHEQRLPQFRLHIFTAGNRLNEARLDQMASTWVKADLYLCGPDKLKQLMIPLWQRNVVSGRIYHEDFDFRSGVKLPSLQHKKAPVLLSQVS